MQRDECKPNMAVGWTVTVRGVYFNPGITVYHSQIWMTMNETRLARLWRGFKHINPTRLSISIIKITFPYYQTEVPGIESLEMNSNQEDRNRSK